jgi:hypothetical protein
VPGGAGRLGSRSADSSPSAAPSARSAGSRLALVLALAHLALLLQRVVGALDAVCHALLLRRGRLMTRPAPCTVL